MGEAQYHLPSHLAAEVCRTYSVIHEQVRRGITEDDLASFEHVATIGDIERHESVLFHQENSNTFFADCLDGVEDELDKNW